MLERMTNNLHSSIRCEAEEKFSNVARTKKRSRSCDMDMNCTARFEKRCKKEGELKNCESGTEISDDSAYTSYGALPLTPLDSVQLPSLLGSCQGLSVESSYTSTNRMHEYNFADSETSPAEEPMELFIPEQFSTPIVSARHDRILYYRKNYILLKESIEPLHKMLDQLISQGCRDGLISEKIREAQSREMRADILVKYAVKHINQGSFEDLLRITDHGHLIDNMKQRKVSVCVITEDDDDCNLLSDTQFQKYMCSEIEPLLLIDKLLEEGVLNFNDHDDLLKTSFRPERVKNLLKYLANSPRKHLQYLFVILKQEYPELIDEFHNEKAMLAQDIRPDFEMERTTGGWRLGKTSREDQYAKVQLHLKLCPASSDVEMRVIERSEQTNMDVEYSQKLLDLKQENIDFGSIVIVHRQLTTHAIKKLKEACATNEITKYIKSLFTADDIEQMRSDGVTAFVLTITAEANTSQDNHLKITKEAMVRHFSFIAKEIIDAHKFYPGFLESGVLNAESEKILRELNDKSIEERNVEFLNFVIRGQPDMVQIFQYELARLGYAQILKKLCFDDEVSTRRKITGNELVKNTSFLLSELEPKEFLPALETIMPEDVINGIVCTHSRRDRVKLFLNEMVERGQKAVDIFICELKRLDRHYVLDILQASDSSYSGIDSFDAFQIRVCILDNYESFISELEPKMFRAFFLEKGVIDEDKLEAIIKLPTRRKRAVTFLKWLLDEGTSKALIDFKHAVSIFCDKALVKKFEAPESLSIFEWSPPLLDNEDDCVCTSVLLYSATFKVTFYYDLTSSDSKMLEQQSQQSNTNKKINEKDKSSLEKETCTHVCVVNPKEVKHSSNTDPLPDFTYNEVKQSSITTNGLHSTSCNHSSQSGESRKLNSDSMVLIPDKKVSLDHKVTKWLLQHVMDDSKSNTPLPNDLQAVRVEPLSGNTSPYQCEFSGNMESESAVTETPQQVVNFTNCKVTKTNRSASIRRKDSTTADSTLAYESTVHPSVSADDNYSMSDQGYMSYQDCDQMTLCSYTSAGFDTRISKTTESSFPTSEDAEHCPSNSSLLNSQSLFRKPRKDSVSSPPVIQKKRSLSDKHATGRRDIAKSPLSFDKLSHPSATCSSRIGSPSSNLWTGPTESSSPTYCSSGLSPSPNPSLSSFASSPYSSTVIMSPNISKVINATKERQMESRRSYGSPYSDEVLTHLSSPGSYSLNSPICSSPLFGHISSPPEHRPSVNNPYE